jgi:hypothetical protein
MTSLTDYQKAQLLYFSLHGTFKYTNTKGNKVSRQAWLAMLKALTTCEFIAETNSYLHMTAKGRNYLNAEHLNISLAVLE